MYIVKNMYYIYIHTHHITEFLITSIVLCSQELLASKHILKVGVASYEDGQKIVKDYGCRVSGALDLRTLADALQLPSRKSLAAMSLEYLNLEMDKIAEVRCGDWDVCTLSDEQVAYAACDALASVIIYHKVRKLIENNFFI